MGCSESRGDNSEEEVAISFAEKALGFSGQSEERLDYIIRKYSAQNMISLAQFNRIAKELALRIENYSSHSKITPFYDGWRNEHGEIPRTEFLALALLLCQGNKETVARLLFQCFDDTSERAMRVEEFQRMTDTIFKICLKTGNLVVDHQTEKSSEARILQHIQQLAPMVPQAVYALGRVFVPNSEGMITEDNFVSTVMRVNAGIFATSGGWRAFIRNELANNPDKAALVNPYRNPQPV